MRTKEHYQGWALGLPMEMRRAGLRDRLMMRLIATSLTCKVTSASGPLPRIHISHAPPASDARRTWALTRRRPPRPP
eukprot:130231-Pyramimonas_sp.AAC.1